MVKLKDRHRVPFLKASAAKKKGKIDNIVSESLHAALPDEHVLDIYF